jgi:hypothetical protein
MPSKSAFKNGTNLQIRLLRDRNQRNDDQIAIRYEGEDLYHLFYRSGNTSLEKPVTYYLVLTGDELDTYLTNLFPLLVRDTDPFAQIQFDLPCYPSLLYDIQDLRQGKIRTALWSVLPLLSTAGRLN